MSYHLTMKSHNAKTGPIPVSTSTARTCPDACGFKRKPAMPGGDSVSGGCYAAGGPLAMHWAKVTDGERGMSWGEFCAAVRTIKPGALWRHNQAGDLPGVNDALDVNMLADLVEANKGRKGFTYTHKPLATVAERNAIRVANVSGFTVNLSADNLADADRLADMGIAPVAVVMDSETKPGAHVTPAGRAVRVCPATYRDDVTCATCKACANPTRGVIIGFPAHGSAKRKASAVVRMVRKA